MPSFLGVVRVYFLYSCVSSMSFVTDLVFCFYEAGKFVFAQVIV